MTRLLVFDSGIGGLSVVSEIRRSQPNVEIIYVADDAAFPYGDWDAVELLQHAVQIIEDLARDFAPDAVVIACNTASTLILPSLRARLSIPVVGTVPAIKPAAARTESGLISVLATDATMRRDYTRDLIRSFAQRCEVRLVGSSRLAQLAEDHMSGRAIDHAEVLAEIKDAFVVGRDGRKTDTIVLACTHYPFLGDIFRKIAPWVVEWIDPSDAIARRVVSIMGSPVTRQNSGAGRALLTSGKSWPSASIPLLKTLALVPGPNEGGNPLRNPG